MQDGVNGYAVAQYRYKLPDSDFSFDLDISNYTVNSADHGLYVSVHLTSETTKWDISTCRDVVRACFHQEESTPLYHAHGQFRINNATGEDVISTSGILAAKYRMRRVGTTLYIDAYTSVWETVTSADFGSRAGEPRNLYIIAEDNTNRGGRVDFDDLIIHSGCPTGSDYSWT